MSCLLLKCYYFSQLSVVKLWFIHSCDSVAYLEPAGSSSHSIGWGHSCSAGTEKSKWFHLVCPLTGADLAFLCSRVVWLFTCWLRAPRTWKVKLPILLKVRPRIGTAVTSTTCWSEQEKKVSPDSDKKYILPFDRRWNDIRKQGWQRSWWRPSLETVYHRSVVS